MISYFVDVVWTQQDKNLFENLDNRPDGVVVLQLRRALGDSNEL